MEKWLGRLSPDLMEAVAESARLLEDSGQQCLPASVGGFVPDAVDDTDEGEEKEEVAQEVVDAHDEPMWHQREWWTDTSTTSTIQRPPVPHIQLRNDMAANQPRVIKVNKEATQDIARRLLKDHVGHVPPPTQLTELLLAWPGLIGELMSLLQTTCGGSAGFVGPGGGIGTSYLSLSPLAVKLARKAGLKLSPLLDTLLGGIEKAVKDAGGELQSNLI